MDRISQQIEEASRRAALARAAEGNLAAQSEPKGGASPEAHRSPEAVTPDAQVNVNSDSLRLPAGKALELNFEELQSKRIINGGQSRFAEVYRVLRTRVLQQMRQNKWSTLGVTSANPKAGKTTTAVNLSLAIARDPSYQSVLLDCDFRRPSAHKSLQIQPESGLIDYLGGSAELEDIVFSDGSEGWRFLPAGSVPFDAPSELLNSNRMRELLQMIRLEQENTIAIVDLPPSSVGDDVIALSVELDAMLVVIEDGVTNERELRNAIDFLSDSNIVGVVLNKAEKDAEFVYSYYE